MSANGKHRHHYVEQRHTIKDDPNKRGGKIRFSFMKCDAPGDCGERNKMIITRYDGRRAR